MKMFKECSWLKIQNSPNKSFFKFLIDWELILSTSNSIFILKDKIYIKDPKGNINLAHTKKLNIYNNLV